MTETQLGLHVLIAAVLGGFIGWQRARWGKSAGTRTYALVAAGSALFTLLARYGFANDSAYPNVAANIVTGIGFLGVGVIFHKGQHVDGLTTAAGLWAVGAVGMAIGLSFYITALLATTIFFLVLLIDPKITDPQEQEVKTRPKKVK